METSKGRGEEKKLEENDICCRCCPYYQLCGVWCAWCMSIEIDMPRSTRTRWTYKDFLCKNVHRMTYVFRLYPIRHIFCTQNMNATHMWSEHVSIHIGLDVARLFSLSFCVRAYVSAFVHLLLNAESETNQVEWIYRILYKRPQADCGDCVTTTKARTFLSQFYFLFG